MFGTAQQILERVKMTKLVIKFCHLGLIVYHYIILVASDHREILQTYTYWIYLTIIDIIQNWNKPLELKHIRGQNFFQECIIYGRLRRLLGLS